MFSELIQAVIVRFVDIGGIFDHHSLNFLFTMNTSYILTTIIYMGKQAGWKYFIWQTFSNTPKNIIIFALLGGHLNPAVTLGFCITGNTKWWKLPIYSIVQLAGAFVAAAAQFGIYHGKYLVISKQENKCCKLIE